MGNTVAQRHGGYYRDIVAIETQWLQRHIDTVARETEWLQSRG